jgi:hypothetical protein
MVLEISRMRFETNGNLAFVPLARFEVIVPGFNIRN